jgi:hypothetical protein
MLGPKQVDQAALLCEVSLEGHLTARAALQNTRCALLMERGLRQTKAPATVANAGEGMIMEMGADLF